MKPLLLAAALALANETADLRADFLAGKPLPPGSPAAQVQKGRYELLDQVAQEWKLSPDERRTAEELYKPKYLFGAVPGAPPQTMTGAAMTERASQASMARATDIASRLKWDRSAGDMPAGNPAAGVSAGIMKGLASPQNVAVPAPVDYKALNAQSRGGPNTVKINAVPALNQAPNDTDKMKQVFANSVARMDREGLRDPGSGAANGVWNNIQASLMPGSKKLRCFDQAEQLVGDLEKAGFDRKKWTFRIRSYSGEGHEANGHYWVEAVSKDRNQQTVVMDPWANTVKTIDMKEETVIKPYGAYWMGWAMDKVGL